MSLSAWIMWLISVCLMFGALIGFAAWLDRKQEKHAAKRRALYGATREEAIESPKGIWRVGRHLGRTLYIQTSEDPSDEDVVIGMMDTAELAQTVIDAVNEKHRREGPWIS